GENVTMNGCDAPGATITGACSVAANGPLAVSALTVSVSVPGFVIVIVCGAEVVPTSTIPKSSEGGATAIAGDTPLPVSGTVVGLLFASLVMVIVPLAAPTTSGWKVTCSFTSAPGCTVTGPLIPLSANGPVAVTPTMSSGA